MADAGACSDNSRRRFASPSSDGGGGGSSSAATGGSNSCCWCRSQSGLLYFSNHSAGRPLSMHLPLARVLECRWTLHTFARVTTTHSPVRSRWSLHVHWRSRVSKHVRGRCSAKEQPSLLCRAAGVELIEENSSGGEAIGQGICAGKV